MCRTLSVMALVALYVGLVHSWDLAIAEGELLEFYIEKTKTATVRFKSQKLAALAYDEVHNMILYVDKQSNNDSICGFDLSSMQYRCLTERNGRNIQGLAFDPVTEYLFFTDTIQRSINWISLKPGSKNNVYGTTLIKMDDGIPTDIAVDSCSGYIYWINTNLTTPTIERARFNGSEREVIINPTLVSVNTTYSLEPHSLVIDQQTQQIYWVQARSRSFAYGIYGADLNGNNKKPAFYYRLDDTEVAFSNLSNTLTVSKESLFMVGWCSTCSLWHVKKATIASFGTNAYESNKHLALHIKIPASIVANYKLSDQIQGKQDCQALKSLVQNISLTDNTLKITAQYEAEFCVHGVQVDGQSLCKCTPGYIGERCDVSVCENYCLHGNCSTNDEGLPKCSCDAGYTGERCQVDVCHGYCQNDGDCSLNEKSQPICECKGDVVGVRCEVTDCLNYCIQGNCSINDEGLPKCGCDAGYSGDRCEVSACHGYCLNDGECSLSEEEEPICQCVGNHEGLRCEAVKTDHLTTALTTYSERNLTLADIFANWRKPISKISVILESS